MDFLNAVLLPPGVSALLDPGKLLFFLLCGIYLMMKIVKDNRDL